MFDKLPACRLSLGFDQLVQARILRQAGSLLDVCGIELHDWVAGLIAGRPVENISPSNGK
jgi:hypothetical protein